jgi:hypothetical protein
MFHPEDEFACDVGGYPGRHQASTPLVFGIGKTQAGADALPTTTAEERLALLLRMEGLDNVAFLKAVEPLDADTALEPGRDLTHIVFEVAKA